VNPHVGISGERLLAVMKSEWFFADAHSKKIELDEQRKKFADMIEFAGL
jgi:hypothetical protein